MANEKISSFTSITNAGTLQAAVIDPNQPGQNFRTTMPASGAQGPQGAVGPQGTVGPQGAVGAQGSIGPQGAVGAQGPQGPGGGGGGGSYTAGLGIYFSGTSPTTIGNTGTIVQPRETGTTSGLGIHIRAGDVNGADGALPGNMLLESGYVTQAGTGTIARGSNLALFIGNVYVTDPTGDGESGSFNVGGGGVYNGTVAITGAAIAGGSGSVYGTTAAQGSGFFSYGGAARNASVTNFGGGWGIFGGDATGGETAKGGGIVLTPGYASGGSTTNANGVFIVNYIPTSDPHVYNQKFQTSIAGVGYVGVYSKG